MATVTFTGLQTLPDGLPVELQKIIPNTNCWPSAAFEVQTTTEFPSAHALEPFQGSFVDGNQTIPEHFFGVCIFGRNGVWIQCNGRHTFKADPISTVIGEGCTHVINNRDVIISTCGPLGVSMPNGTLRIQ